MSSGTGTATRPETAQGAPVAGEPAGQGVAFASLAISLVALFLAATVPVWTPAIYKDTTRAEMQRQLADTTARLETVSRRLEEVQLPAFLVSAVDLQDALGRSEPFDRQLTLFRTVAGADPEVERIAADLAKYAKSGVPTTRRLQAAFGDVAHAVLLAERPATDDGTMSRALAQLSATAARVSNLIVGEKTGADAVAVIGRAEARVNEGNLEQAIEELGALSTETAKAAAADWIAAARARLTVEQSALSLGGVIIKRSAFARTS